MFFFPGEAFQRKVILPAALEDRGDRPNRLPKQTISKSYIGQTHIPISSTSPFISRAEPCELLLLSHIFKPLICIQLIWLQFAFSVNATIQKEMQEGGGGETDFQIVFEMWTDCKWSEQVGCLENRQRCCRPQLCRSTSGSPLCARRVSLRRAALSASLDQKQQWTRELSENREIVGWQGLNCRVEQLFLTELPVLSALKEADYFVVLPQSHTDILYS